MSMNVESDFDYITDYDLKVCLDYMKHDNIYDVFTYEWKEIQGRQYTYYMKFKEYKNSWWRRLGNCPVQAFEVIFEELGDQTAIHVNFIRGPLGLFLQFVTDKYIDMFWKQKLNAQRTNI